MNKRISLADTSSLAPHSRRSKLADNRKSIETEELLFFHCFATLSVSPLLLFLHFSIPFSVHFFLLALNTPLVSLEEKIN